jgi:hypothetical protein
MKLQPTPATAISSADSLQHRRKVAPLENF